METLKQVIVMRITRLFDKIANRALLPGILFLSVNIYSSYIFYHVNSYKIALVGLGTTLLFFRDDIFNIVRGDREKIKIQPWGLFAWLLLPLAGTIPGLLLFGKTVNYNFPYELATALIVILWAGYLFRRLEKKRDMFAFLAWIGITILYVGTLSWLEKFGYSPFEKNNLPVPQVKTTFGNINYFAGFLILLLPLFFVLVISPFEKTESGIDPVGKKHRFFFGIVFLFGLLALGLTLSRTAIFAFGVSIIVVVLLIAFFLVSSLWKRRLLAVSGMLVLLAMIAVGVLYWKSEAFASIRLADVFSSHVWYGRLVPWRAAWEAILDSPVFGYGLGSSYNLFFRYLKPDTLLYWHQRSYNHVHSELLELLQEGGIVGLLAWLGMWGYFLKKVFRTLQSPSSSQYAKTLLVGILGGLAAYHLQSLFSVAPRMMVVKLPLYSLIGIGFLLTQEKQKTKPFLTILARYPKLALTIPTTLTILLFWGLYAPWIYSQYHFVRIMQQREISRVVQLEQLMDNAPNIYALDILALQQLQYRRIPQLRKTLRQMDETIPYFRRSGFMKAAMYFYNGKLYQAKREALAYQKRDSYESMNINLLARIAAIERDRNDYLAQLKKIVTYWVIWKGVDGFTHPDQIRVTVKENMPSILLIQEETGSFQLTIQSHFLEEVMNYSVMSLRQQHLPKKTAELLRNKLEQQTRVATLFQTPINKKLSAPLKKEQQQKRRLFALSLKNWLKSQTGLRQ